MTETTVAQWIRQHAHPLTTLDPQAPLADLLPLADLVRDSAVVAVGAATRQAHELSTLAHRAVRFLVEQQGFRSLALEGDDAVRLGLDAYISTGTGDPKALLSEARSFWQTEEILDVVRWMRSYNRRHQDDPVRFVEDLGRPRTPGLRMDSLAGIEQGLAESTIRWQEETGDKIVYWGGLAHTAVSSSRNTYSTPSPHGHRNAGSYLRERFGTRYVSIGLTFHHGTAPYLITSPPEDFADATLGRADLDTYLLNLRTDSPASVRAWLDAPTKTRMIGPAYDPEDNDAYRISDGSLAGWFDAVIHSQVVTPVGLLAPPSH
ncbi:erythromycin esterase family protein [Streptomyces sp. NBC_01511]|uniref:erythromycin esterase family protein n=1 Tax=Streptomyces sp. NBC_01511 TaxID=2903889 RepID=UPI0038636D39